MLVLSRKPLETIFIGNDIKITLLRATDGSARIGIEAPRHIPVTRGELLNRPAVAAQFDLQAIEDALRCANRENAGVSLI